MLLGARATAALLSSSALLLVSAAPGTAAEPVAQATATALELTIASTPTDSGTYSVTNDGTRETSSGSNEPLVTALGGQSFLQAGTLAQDATTRVIDGNGSSAACAGLAGDGATLVAAGDGACLTPGDNVTINAGTIDLSDLTIVEGDLLAGLEAQLGDALAPLLDAILPALSGGLEQALTALGDLDVSLDIGTVQSQCTAAVGTADGDSQLVDSGLSVTVAGTQVDILSLPVDPAPNTKVLTGLDDVVTAVLDGVREQLEVGLDGVADPLDVLTDAVQDTIVEEVLAQLAPQLAPLEENLLDGTLNKQVRPAADEIEVTALDLAVLPAAAEFGVELLSLEIGRSTCGPSGRVAAPPSDTPTPTATTTPAVPTSVPAGGEASVDVVSSDGAVNGLLATGALAALAVLAVGAGTAAYRRALR